MVSAYSYMVNYFFFCIDWGFNELAVALRFIDFNVLVGLASDWLIVAFLFKEFPARFSFGGPLSLSYSTVYGSVNASCPVSR